MLPQLLPLAPRPLEGRLRLGVPAREAVLVGGEGGELVGEGLLAAGE